MIPPQVQPDVGGTLLSPLLRELAHVLAEVIYMVVSHWHCDVGTEPA